MSHEPTLAELEHNMAEEVKAGIRDGPAAASWEHGLKQRKAKFDRELLHWEYSYRMAAANGDLLTIEKLRAAVPVPWPALL